MNKEGLLRFLKREINKEINNEKRWEGLSCENLHKKSTISNCKFQIQIKLLTWKRREETRKEDGKKKLHNTKWHSGIGSILYSVHKIAEANTLEIAVKINRPIFLNGEIGFCYYTTNTPNCGVMKIHSNDMFALLFFSSYS